MTSARKIAANRENAQRSTGPNTAHGKARSRYNAVKSGIYSGARLLPGEDEDAYCQLLQRLCKRFAPSDPVEELLLDQMLGHVWRIQRLEHAEQTYLKKMFSSHVANGTRNPKETLPLHCRLPSKFEQQQAQNEKAACSHSCHELLTDVKARLGTTFLEASIPLHEANPLLRLGAQRRGHIQDILAIEAILDATSRGY